MNIKVAVSNQELEEMGISHEELEDQIIYRLDNVGYEFVGYTVRIDIVE